MTGKGKIGTFMDGSRSHISRLCRAVTEGRNYQELYGISKETKRCDADNMLVGAIGLLIGFVIWFMTALWPFIVTGRFHMGTGALIGLGIIFASITYYIGSFRILRALSKHTGTEMESRIYNILKDKKEDVTLIENADNPTETA